MPPRYPRPALGHSTSRAPMGALRPRLAGIALAGLLVAGAVAARSGELDAPIASLTGWAAASGPLGALALSLIMPIWVVALLPAFLLTMAAGVAWGPVLGAAIVHVPQVLGMGLAFLAGRYLFRDAIARRVASDPRFDALDRAVRARGFSLVLLLRLSPVVPYNVLNYALGLTSIRFGPYLLASAIGALPSTFLFTYLGASLGRISTGQATSPFERALWWGGLVATVILTALVTRLARRAVRDALDATVPERSPENRAALLDHHPREEDRRGAAGGEVHASPELDP